MSHRFILGIEIQEPLFLDQDKNIWSPKRFIYLGGVKRSEQLLQGQPQNSAKGIHHAVLISKEGSTVILQVLHFAYHYKSNYFLNYYWRMVLLSFETWHRIKVTYESLGTWIKYCWSLISYNFIIQKK